VFKSSLHREPGTSLCVARFSSRAPLAREGALEEKQEALAKGLCRLNLNDPPTAVGGISGRFIGTVAAVLEFRFQPRNTD